MMRVVVVQHQQRCHSQSQQSLPSISSSAIVLKLFQLLTIGLLLLKGTATTAQEADLNYMAITGWFEGCNNSTAAAADGDRCVGLPYTQLPSPVYLELDNCYVNPSSPASVTYYKKKNKQQSTSTTATAIIEFNIIFTNPDFARMPTNCNQQGVCTDCGNADEFGTVQEQVGDVSCNDLFSFTYQCQSREIVVFESTSCYVPHYATYDSITTTMNDDDDDSGETTTTTTTTSILECSMVASIQSIVPTTTTTTTAAPVETTIINAPTTTAIGGSDANMKPPSTSSPSTAPSIQPALPTVPTNFPVRLRTPVPTTRRAPTYSNNGIDDDDDDDEYSDDLERNPGLLAGAILVGIAFCALFLWAGRPPEGYTLAIQTSISSTCDTLCCCCGIGAGSCCRVAESGDDTKAALKEKGYYHKTTEEDNTNLDRAFAKDNQIDKYNDAMSLASVSQASLTQAGSRSLTTTGEKKNNYLMMVDEDKENFMSPPLFAGHDE